MTMHNMDTSDKAFAIADLPDPLNPVNHSVAPFCPKYFSRDGRSTP